METAVSTMNWVCQVDEINYAYILTLVQSLIEQRSESKEQSVQTKRWITMFRVLKTNPNLAQVSLNFEGYKNIIK